MHWVEVLNEAVRWQETGSRDDLEVGILWRLFASRYLDVPLSREDAAALSQWLAAVTLDVERDGAGRLHLAASREAAQPPARHKSLLSAALVQLLAETDATLAAVHRCHGIVRGDAAARRASNALEARFAERARLAALVDGVSVHQCPLLVHGARGARYCSKACSNAGFAARKAESEPRYFAAKQERYRTRRERRTGVHPDRGAFVYID